ncbi:MULTISPECIES: DUF2065 domain-containing protein [Thiorhodovibrio]|jgi:uncharacterized protein YjeT (DUF2065 family)|uniref:DUF2065 domain-containing protein n=1 Tax=Thiorhodovibrio TaxID=61593 RepID=UPI001911CC87|nr:MULTISPECIES: DUF2065 domain-containing protein [Thiorhodovibrio]MBK5969555.1 DUF2065 domain-containing protein [Thiorhodovibrio winogradskyi]WPL13946.1 hypothetical protein Thiosp_03773 [Thiorhodovibrio litoralis]
MWHDLLVALALVFVIEGVMPFLAPEAMRRMMLDVSQQTNRSLRVAGLMSMAGGVAMLYFVN